jgi:hypothetical protein
MAKAKKESTDKNTAASTAAKGAGSAAPAPKKAPAAKKAAAPTAAAASAAAPAKAGGKKATASKSSKSSGPSAPSQRPLIDTDLAASAAAAMVANRNLLGSAGSAGSAGAGAMKESSTFRQLKESLNNPAASNLDGILGAGTTQQKKSQGHGPDRQVGRNQTFGADVNRAGVPRRTSGG